MRSPLESAKSGKLERLRRERGKEKSMRGSAPRWRRLRRKKWRRREKWKRGWSVNATSAVTKAEEADVEVGGMIGRQDATLLHEVVVVVGGMEGDLHQGDEDLLLNVLGCSLLQGLSAGQVEEEVVDGESARGRRRNPGVPAAEMATDPQGGTHLLAEDLHREGAHLREGAALHAGMKDEAMLEVGDAEVGLHQEEARRRGVGLLPG